MPFGGILLDKLATRSSLRIDNRLTQVLDKKAVDNDIELVNFLNEIESFVC